MFRRYVAYVVSQLKIGLVGTWQLALRPTVHMEAAEDLEQSQVVQGVGTHARKPSG